MGAAGGAIQAGLGAAQIINAKNSADAAKAQAEFMAQQDEFNAQLLEYRKNEIGEIAQENIDVRQQQVRQMLGSQKVALAAQGIEVEGDIGEQLAEQERKLLQQDVEAIKNNAWREVFGLEQKQLDLRSSAAFTRVEGSERARQTMVTGGLAGLGNIVEGGSKAGLKFGPKIGKTKGTKSGRISPSKTARMPSVFETITRGMGSI